MPHLAKAATPETVTNVYATFGEGERALLIGVVRTFLEAAAGRRPTAGLFDYAAVAWASQHAAELVTRITSQTRDGIRAMVERAVRDGWTAHKLQEELQDSHLFSRDRALMIARTEAAFATNAGEATRWAADGVRYVEIIDGTEDPYCDHANGQIWTIEEFRANPIAHPNCVRRAIPLRASYIDPSKLGFSIDPPRPGA